MSLNRRPLSSARVQIHYSIVLCLSKCLYTSTLVVINSVIPSPLVKLNSFKTPESEKQYLPPGLREYFQKGFEIQSEQKSSISVCV